MSKIIDKVNNFILDNHMISTGDRIVLGLSGGADSVCLLILLLDICSRYGLGSKDIYAVHINHKIRGEEADEDMEFARKLCQEKQVNFIAFSKDIVALAKEEGISTEEAGRRFRYECFDKVAGEYGCTKIAVAHNKNDMAETVVFNMLRGTGLRGMSGIKPVRGNIIRPLLNITREEIIEYLREKDNFYHSIGLEGIFMKTPKSISWPVELVYARYMFYKSIDINIDNDNYDILFELEPVFFIKHGKSNEQLMEEYPYPKDLFKRRK